jgi:hypothetical protein
MLPAANFISRLNSKLTMPKKVGCFRDLTRFNLATWVESPLILIIGKNDKVILAFY